MEKGVEKWGRSRDLLGEELWRSGCYIKRKGMWGGSWVNLGYFFGDLGWRCRVWEWSGRFERGFVGVLGGGFWAMGGGFGVDFWKMFSKLLALILQSVSK